MKRQSMLVAFSAFLTISFSSPFVFVSNAESPKKPKEFCPINAGATWTYKIKLGEVKPLSYEGVMWHQGENFLVQENRGYFIGSLTKKKSEFILKIRIDKLVSFKDSPKGSVTAVLQIKKDELGIFQGSKRIHFDVTGKTGKNTFRVIKVALKDASMPGAIPGAERGTSLSCFFFADEPGAEFAIQSSPSELLTFVGPSKLPVDNVSGLHFQRIVEPAKGKRGGRGSDLEKGFTEDTWFVRGQGLTYLVQKVDGKTSMTWTLTKYSKYTWW